MAEERVKALIHQYDTLVRYRHKLPDYNFAEELLSVWSSCLKYQEADAAQLCEKTKVCEKLKERLDIVHDVVAKSYMQFEDHIKHYQVLLNNNHVNEFRDFTVFLKARSESLENVNAVLESENDNLKNELEALKLHNSTLNSDLKLAQESLNEEKSQRELMEEERKNLEYLSEKLSTLLLKYQQRNDQLEETKETTTQASCDDSNSCINESDSDIVLRIDTSTSENSLDENNCSDTFVYNDQSTIPPPFGFGDDDISVKNIDPNVFSPKKQEHCAETNTLEEAFSGCNQILRLTTRAVELSNPKVSIMPEESHFECDTCGRFFSKKIGIIAHVRVHMKKIQSFRSEKYGKPFPAENRTITLEKYSTCNEGDSFHGNKNRKTIIIEAFENERSVKNTHIGDYSDKSRDKVTGIRCTICNKHYSYKSSLITHIRVIHNGERPYKCTECGKRFGSIGHLKRHTFVHGSQKPFKCSVCHEGFKDPSVKTRHERVVHEESARLQCAHCDKLFGRKQALIYHIHTTHFSGFQKQFKCTICDKSFALEQQLQRHMFSHSSKRSFKCSVCDRTFKHPYNKTHHEKTVHRKGARFYCKHCDKVYQRKVNLIRHLQKNHAE